METKDIVYTHQPRTDRQDEYRPLVSIIIACRNNISAAKKCLESVRNQTYKNIELIVVDNFSSDGTYELARKYADQVFQLGPERSTQFNFGFSKSKGELIYRIGMEFVLENDLVEKAVAKILQGSDAIALHNRSKGDGIWAKVRYLERESYKGDNSIVAVRFMKREVFESVGMFDESLVAGEDFDLHNRIVSAGYKWTHLDAVEDHIGEPKSIMEVWSKFYYYGRTIRRYQAKAGIRGRRQLGFFRPSFKKMQSELIRQPLLFLAFWFYMVVKYSAGAAGVLAGPPASMKKAEKESGLKYGSVVVLVNTRMYQNTNAGIPNYIHELYSRLDNHSKAERYVFLQGDRNKLLGETFTTYLPRGTIGNVFFDLIGVGVLSSKLAKKLGARVFHAPSGILPLFGLRGIRKIVTVHDLAFLKFPEQYPMLFRHYYTWGIRRSVHVADQIIAVSQSTKDDLVSLFGADPRRIQVIPLAGRTLRAENTDERRIKKPYIFMISTHPKRKNITGAIEAFAMLENDPNIVFVLAGIISESTKKMIETLGKQRGVSKRITILGYVTDDDLANLYRSAILFLYPSFYEGFGIPILESMMLGCPVLTSNVGATAELVKDGHYTFDPHNTKQIAEKIRFVLQLSDQDREALIHKNTSYAKQYTWDQTAISTRNILLTTATVYNGD